MSRHSLKDWLGFGLWVGIPLTPAVLAVLHFFYPDSWTVVVLIALAVVVCIVFGYRSYGDWY